MSEIHHKKSSGGIDQRPEKALMLLIRSIVASCEMHGVNPEVYIADILLRIQHHKNKNIIDLLPHRWKELFAPGIPNNLIDTG